jgi:hypothetical protein
LLRVTNTIAPPPGSPPNTLNIKTHEYGWTMSGGFENKQRLFNISGIWVRAREEL